VGAQIVSFVNEGLGRSADGGSTAWTAHHGAIAAR
jgi:hypothetical protein